MSRGLFLKKKEKNLTRSKDLTPKSDFLIFIKYYINSRKVLIAVAVYSVF